MRNILKMGIFALTLIILSSCKKETPDPTPAAPASTDNVALKISHSWTGASTFGLNTDYVHPVTGDALNFTMLKYYISNIRLKKADGTWWIQPDSYFLLNLENGSAAEINIPKVPYGEYTDIEYVLGVDSLRNVSGAQAGALSTSNGMFWSWNSGYIMLKAEGTSPNSTSNAFSFHLGGFAGANSVVTKRSHNFVGNSLSVSGNGNCQIQLSAKPENLWLTSPSVSTVSTTHMPGAGAKAMALNFYNSFEFEEINE